MGTFLQDLKYGVRMLRKNLGFTVVAVLALMLGIGANTAIFSVLNVTLLRALPYPNPDELMVVGGLYKQLFDTQTKRVGRKIASGFSQMEDEV